MTNKIEKLIANTTWNLAISELLYKHLKDVEDVAYMLVCKMVKENTMPAYYHLTYSERLPFLTGYAKSLLYDHDLTIPDLYTQAIARMMMQGIETIDEVDDDTVDSENVMYHMFTTEDPEKMAKKYNSIFVTKEFELKNALDSYLNYIMNIAYLMPEEYKMSVKKHGPDAPVTFALVENEYHDNGFVQWHSLDLLKQALVYVASLDKETYDRKSDFAYTILKGELLAVDYPECLPF